MRILVVYIMKLTSPYVPYVQSIRAALKLYAQLIDGVGERGYIEFPFQ